MKVVDNRNLIHKTILGRGDIVVFNDGNKYLIAYENSSKYPYKIINIKDFTIYSSTKSLESYYEEKEKYIKEIISYNNVELHINDSANK